MKIRFPASLRVFGRAFIDWWDSWLDMVLVSGVWFICQLTIILGPPATFGAYYMIGELHTSGTSLGLRGVWDGARKYFGRSLLWGLMNWVAIGLLYVNIGFYGRINAWWGLTLELIVAVMGVLWFCANFYALPYFMLFEVPSLKTALRNGILTTLAAPLYTIVLLAISIVLLALSVGIVLPVFLGVPGLVAVIGFKAVNDRLVAFGLKKPEKTPKEIETEQAGRIFVPNLERAAGDDAPGGEVTPGKGQVEQKK